jgi:hypothetical protein
MAIQLIAKWDEVTSTETLNKPGGSATLSYYANSDTDVTDYEIRQAAKAQTPLTWNGIWTRDSITLNGRISDSGGLYIWDVTVGYVNLQSQEDGNQQPNPTDENTVVYEIRTGGGQSMQMTSSLELMDEIHAVLNFEYRFSTEPALAKLLGINATDAENGSSLTYAGIPVTKGTIELVVHLWRSAFTINSGYLIRVAEAASKNVVNSDIFLNFPARTLRFINFNATAQRGTNPGWDITLTFHYEANVPAATLDDQFPTLKPFTKPKHGHEYLDVLFMPQANPTKNIVVSEPVRAAIQRIYPEVGYNALFGT